MKEIERDWSASFGAKFALISWVYSFISKALAEMKIGPEVMKWVKGDEGIFALREAVEYVGEKFLVAKAVEASMAHQFLKWRTIQRNPNRKTGHDYIHALTAKGCDVTDCAQAILERVSLWDEADEYDLFCLSGNDLGLGNDAVIPRKRLYVVALAKGFMLCPAWIGPELREGFDDQPYNEYVQIAMSPVPLRNDLVGAFGLLKEEGVCGQKDHVLFNAQADNGRFNIVHTRDQLIFAKRRPKLVE